MNPYWNRNRKKWINVNQTMKPPPVSLVLLLLQSGQTMSVKLLADFMSAIFFHLSKSTNQIVFLACVSLISSHFKASSPAWVIVLEFMFNQFQLVIFNSWFKYSPHPADMDCFLHHNIQNFVILSLVICKIKFMRSAGKWNCAKDSWVYDSVLWTLRLHRALLRNAGMLLSNCSNNAHRHTRLGNTMTGVTQFIWRFIGNVAV